MCTDKVLTVKKLYKELDAKERRQVLNTVLWDVLSRVQSRVKQQQYDYIISYLDKCCCNVVVTPRGKNSNVLITDEEYNQLVTDFGQAVVDKAIDHLSDRLLTKYRNRVTTHYAACRVFCEAQQRYDAKHDKQQQPSDNDNLGRMARL